MANFRDIITSDECFEVVRKSHLEDGTFHVIDYRLDQVPGKPGYLGEYAHLVVTVQLKCGSRRDFKYFAKCMPFTDPKEREFVEECGIFTKEAHCYKDLFTKFEQNPEKVIKWKPDCWLARDDLMVMEDLIDEGYRTMPFQRSFGKDHLVLILERMAQMHACSLDLEYNQMKGEKLGDRFGGMLFETTFMRENPWFVAGMKGLLKVAMDGSKYSLNPEYKSVIQSQMMDKIERIYELTQPTNHFQSVIVHRDMWCNNLMFRFGQDHSGAVNYDEPLECVLIDFQIARYLPPATDFLCAIYLLTRRSDRDQLFDFYVKYYHDQLTEKLRKLNLQVADILPMEKFLESLEHYKLYGLVWSGVLRAFVNFPEGFLHELHENDPEAYHELWLVRRDVAQMKAFESDTYYRETLLDSIDETLEYLFEFK